MSLVPGQDFTPERMTLALAPPTGVNVNILAVKPKPVLEEALVG